MKKNILLGFVFLSQLSLTIAQTNNPGSTKISVETKLKESQVLTTPAEAVKPNSSNA